MISWLRMGLHTTQVRSAVVAKLRILAGGEAAVQVSDELRAQLRYFVDVLFFFERSEMGRQIDLEPATASTVIRKECEPPRFEGTSGNGSKLWCVPGSIAGQSAVDQVDQLYTVGTLQDHRYVFLHVVRCRGVSQWSHFVQFNRVGHAQLPPEAGPVSEVPFCAVVTQLRNKSS